MNGSALGHREAWRQNPAGQARSAAHVLDLFLTLEALALLGVPLLNRTPSELHRVDQRVVAVAARVEHVTRSQVNVL